MQVFRREFFLKERLALCGAGAAKTKTELISV
jgi:hypothetical protein